MDQAYVGETLGWRVYVDPHGLLRPEVFFASEAREKIGTQGDF